MIETPAEILAHFTSKEAAESFCARRKKKKAPLTETAALRICKTLAAIKAAGGDPSDALGMAEERGWASITPEWYFKAVHAETPMKAQTPMGDRLGLWAAAAAADAARAAAWAAAGAAQERQLRKMCAA